MNIEISSLIITVALAFVGYLVTYVNNLRLSQRAERLERVNKQLRELYGPLYARTQASEGAYRYFRAHAPHLKEALAGQSMTDEKQKWLLWMNQIFLPNNEAMYNLILANSDLLIEPEMPQCILDFCTYVTTYKTLQQKWAADDFSESWSEMRYPVEINDYARASFETLSAEQAKLLGKH